MPVWWPMCDFKTAQQHLAEVKVIHWVNVDSHDPGLHVSNMVMGYQKIHVLLWPEAH